MIDINKKGVKNILLFYFEICLERKSKNREIWIF